MPARLFKLVLLASAAAATCGAAHAEDAADAAGKVVDEVVVTRAAQQPVAAVTGLPLTLRETPQSVTIIAPQQIRDFALTSVNDLLAQAPGVNVEEIETDRTQYNARGFDITNFQMDGVGLPLIWDIQFGQLDTAMFDRVEVIRGANALMTGIGNPSATINYVRKRPTATFQGNLAAQVGSWNLKRLEADLSGPLNASGTVRGRVVLAGQEADSYLDYYASKRGVAYGVLAWDVTPDLTLTGGYSRNESKSDGVLWGALPLQYSDGAPIRYPRSASSAADWTYWNVVDKTSFLEAQYALPANWNLKATGTYREFDEHAELLYAFGNPDPVTGEGVFGMAGIYPSEYRQYLLDVTASGPFQAFGRTHELAFGLSGARGQGKEFENFAEDFPAYPAISLWGREQVARPAYPGEYLAANQVDKLYRASAAAHLNLTDELKAVVGATAVKLKSRGYSYGVDTPRDESKVSPYVGVTYDLTSQVSLYASYTDIFNPQSEEDVDHRTLSAARGSSYEAGIKSELFDHRLYLAAAIYQAEQTGLAEAAGVDLDTGKTYYEGLDTKVTGFELEVAGRITENWTLNGGYSDLEIDGPTDTPIRTYIPRRTFKAATTYTLPELRNLRLGAAVRWQDDISTLDLAPYRQKAYVVADLTASIDVTEQVRATLNVRNVGDKKYLRSLMWNQAYYAAPRNVALRVDYAF
ncbi:TonB-dependent siderophore receptor [Phenylobacterium sp. LjRoot219]|uniref:TonB-dependent siderophore receptor n=1 Tax=Phenylobacterium sp. LjRoot219 TaxID=3342283 RepID=UPI003ECFD99F